jgi:prepilin-type N-terminal cleavage/methylation domain-containing protein
MKRDAGFSLVELLVAMVMFVLIIAASANVFTSILTQYKQQSKISETNIEGMIGLEILRQDIEHAGFGLPWDLDLNDDGVNDIQYLEAGVVDTPWVDRWLNDGPPYDAANPVRGGGAEDPATNNSFPPGAIRSLNGEALNGSDVLSIKATNVARNAASQRWTRFRMDSAGNEDKIADLSGFCDPSLTCDQCEYCFKSTDRVIVVDPGSADSNRKTIAVNNSGSVAPSSPAYWYTTYDAATDFYPPDLAIFESPILIYGIKPPGDPVVEPRMPFNRADYYLRIPGNMPGRCAIGTGIFYKGPISHDDGLIPNALPLLDCVADFQVGYRLDDGTYRNAAYSNTLTAAEIREQIREVRVYVLAHEGQKDPNYFHVDPAAGVTTITVGETLGGADIGRVFDFNGTIDDWHNYRWKVYTIVVEPKNIG